MKELFRVLVYAGTTEGRELVEWLTARGCGVTACVATDYGAELMPSRENLTVLAGRQTESDMARIMPEYDCVVDATHPYAVAVSRNVKSACVSTGLAYLRLRRGDGERAVDRGREREEDRGREREEDRDRETVWMSVDSAEEAADLLTRLSGNVLLTTGSKELIYFARSELLQRCYPRVLPNLESLKNCLNLGFAPSKTICMQGPFSTELNVALIRQYDIEIMVTKLSGDAGGFAEKAESARQTGCALITISRPEDEGMSFEEIRAELEERMREANTD